jgi:hypothetical protein
MEAGRENAEGGVAIAPGAEVSFRAETGRKSAL